MGIRRLLEKFRSIFDSGSDRPSNLKAVSEREQPAAITPAAPKTSIPHKHAPKEQYTSHVTGVTGTDLSTKTKVAEPKHQSHEAPTKIATTNEDKASKIPPPKPAESEDIKTLSFWALAEKRLRSEQPKKYDALVQLKASAPGSKGTLLLVDEVLDVTKTQKEQMEMRQWSIPSKVKGVQPI
jgi:hypothetical protein